MAVCESPWAINSMPYTLQFRLSNLHDYHLVKNMNNALNKIVVAAINDQWIKGAKYMVVGYASKYFLN